MKSIKIIGALKARLWSAGVAILLTGTILLGQGSDSLIQAKTSTRSIITVADLAELGSVIIFGGTFKKADTKMSVVPVVGKSTEMRPRIVFGSMPQVASFKAIGKGQCPLCHTFYQGDNVGRCPNLFGIEKRSYARIKEDRYRNEPIKIGETDKGSGIVKGRPDLIPEAYRQKEYPEMTGEDYLRESMLCPSCYVVKGYGKEDDTKSKMPPIHKPPVNLSWLEINAVIAYLQSMDTPGNYSKVTVPVPTEDEIASRAEAAKEMDLEEDDPPEVTCVKPECVQETINILGCHLCHTIPGVEGARGELGPPLHQKIDAPRRIKDPNYKGKAKTAREYVRESILNPNVYVVFNEAQGEPYPAGVMPQDYANKLSPRALDVLVDYIANTQPKEN